MNKLVRETSPYLLQHAGNPVQWYPWGEEALTRARLEDKPILLSIGYAACHWCHVMAHESFEDPQTALLMNTLFVCIKVDREERPDLDQIYMTFVQMTTGSGGWPLHAFLTPDLEPFFGGTYFPPDEHYGRPAWKSILKSVSHFYHTEKQTLNKNLVTIRQAFQQAMQESELTEIPAETNIDAVARQLASYYDPVNGGFGRAPKFPAVQVLTFFLRHYKNTVDKSYLDMVEYSLHKMADGGIYDHLGGGFARYSVDTQWLVPHFEKMLYDNAQLASLYLDTFLVTKDVFYQTIAEEVLEFIRRDLCSSEGGFFSSLDADSEGEEGKYYVWEKAEILNILGEKKGTLFCDIYGVSDAGNFEGKNILYKAADVESIAKSKNVKQQVLIRLVARSKKLLLGERGKRVKPGLDKKILTSWNGLMLSAYARAYQVLGKVSYKTIIKKNISFLQRHLFIDGQLQRSYNKGKSKHFGFLDDYAYLIQGLLDAYEALFETAYLEWAYRLLHYANNNFWDAEHMGYFFTEKHQKNLLVRMKDESDQSIPSATAVMLLNNLRFYSITTEADLILKSEQLMRKYGQNLLNNPYGYASYLQGFDFYLKKPEEIMVITGQNKATELLKTIFGSYLPNKVVLLQKKKSKWTIPIPDLLTGKTAVHDQSTAYVCHNFACSPPVTTSAELKSLLDMDS